MYILYRSVYCIIKDTNDIDPLNHNIRIEIVIYWNYCIREKLSKYQSNLSCVILLLF